MLRSRAGDSVKLVELLDEAVDRATALARSRNPELGDAEAAEVGRAVGIGAIKYADLSSDRHQGLRASTGSGCCRSTATPRPTCSTRTPGSGRSSGGPASAARPDAGVSPGRAGRAGARLRAGRLRRGGRPRSNGTWSSTTWPAYLHRLATAFSAFYERCPVLRADEPVRESRLVLCDLTARVLRQGLHLLGIRTPERM